MNVEEIIIEYLKANGFDGLAGDECGCEISDLVPCDSDPCNCVPGYKVPCDCDDEDGCGLSHSGCDWHICSTKPDNKKDEL